MPQFKILLVDPNLPMNNPMASWLTDRAHSVATVNDLSHALSIVKTERPDVVFITAQFPLTEVLAWLRHYCTVLERQQAAVVVGLEGTVMVPDLLGFNVVEVVRQPCTFEELEGRCFLAKRRLDVKRNSELRMPSLPATGGARGLAVAEDWPAVDPLAAPSPSVVLSARVQLGSPEVTLEEIAKAHVLGVLEQENGNKARAARKLGIHRRKLYRLLKRFETSGEDVVI